MKKIISSYIEKAIDKDVQLGIGYEDSTTITREIACDILASSVKGQSFLYAHFLENLGFHYSFSSLVQNYDGDDIEPGLIHSARYSVENNYYHTKEWYLRSLVLISWVNNTWYKNNKNNLDNDLINGIDLIINNLMDYYTEISISEKDKYAISIWKNMTNDICKCIGSHSVKKNSH